MQIVADKRHHTDLFGPERRLSGVALQLFQRRHMPGDEPQDVLFVVEQC